MEIKLIMYIAVSVALVLLLLLLLSIKVKHSYYTTGQKKSRTVYVFGKKSFKEKFYYKTGELNKIKRWRFGSLDGKSITFLKNGNEYVVDTYVKGKLIDTQVNNF